jgi:hypothetical protein
VLIHHQILLFVVFLFLCMLLVKMAFAIVAFVFAVLGLGTTTKKTSID